MSSISTLDWVALGWFLAAWAGYGWLSESSRWSQRGLMGVSHRFRLDWAREMLARDLRVSDAALVGNLMQSVSFYANTTIYIIAGLLAVLGALDQAMRFTADLPFARATSRELAELKLLLLLTVFVVAYFKFTWSLRQFNMLSILIGASPTNPDGAGRERMVQRVAMVNSLAGDEFNRGIRAYYFGLAAVAWFIQPWLFLFLTALVVVVLYRRDFTSSVLVVLDDDRG
ncbi:DUF599 domain-containing protein [Aromatoleum petrolei]|uniref:DUF599 family protein n=1 Tax=Aromatoleum petrolei TaxID=76116 RepID=A0ABX1MIM9_9RHOO|nr:DUF599 domain-containing protein [Aromatoleum petrolei]NMF87618.1 DUF599 family protein [Aromatoleum petrolei]QTQ38718.1 putative protein DUF599 [Aromatoleum petrolei]